MSEVQDAIALANRLLAQAPPADPEMDPRWRAIIQLADFVESSPDDVWRFVLRWGSHPDDNVRAAVATCLLEHLLEHHFARFFPLVAQAVSDPRFADTFSLCWKFGQSEHPVNASRFEELRRQIVERRAARRASRLSRRVTGDGESQSA